MTRPEIPASSGAVTADWMERALHAGGMSEVPALQGVLVDRIGGGVGLVGEILRCRLVCRGNAGAIPETVIVKLPSQDSKSRRMSRLQSLYKREYAFYRHVAPHAPVRSPRLLYGDYERRGDRFVLVLEDLGHMQAVDQIRGATPTQARAAVRAVARLHGHFWDRVEKPLLSALHDISRPATRLGIQAGYLAFLVPALKNLGGLFSDELRRLAEAFGPRIWDHLVESTRTSRTFVHGDFRVDNLFFGAGDDVAMVDWQVSGVGSGLYDVAYFLVTGLDIEVRRGIEREALAEYAQVVRGMGVGEFTFDECWLLYRQNVLTLLLIAVFVGGGLDLTNERSRQLVETGIRRTLTAIEDLGAAELMPARPPLVSVSNIVSGLSRTAYLAYRAVR